MKSWKIAALCLLLLSALLAPSAGAPEAWSQINQRLEMPEGWRRIVQGSPFALGEAREVPLDGGYSFLEVGFGSYPSIDGSTVAVPMAIEFARQHLGFTEPDLAGFVAFSTTHHAYENLILKRPNGAPMLAGQNAVLEDAHPVDLVIATEPSDEEKALARENGVELVVEPICFDAFVFITHVDNPVDGLTIEQIQKIYTGEIMDWAEVGGEPGEIRVYQRDKNSGSQTAMENLVMRGMPMTTRGVNFYFMSEMASLVEHVGDYTNEQVSIGYTYKYYIDALYKDDSIKMLAVDGVYPAEENIRSGVYPFFTYYYGVIRKGDEAAPGGLFLEWMRSEEGQRCVRQAGYLPYMPLDGE